MTAFSPRVVQNWIDNQFVPATASSKSFVETHSPHTGDLLAKVPLSSAEDVDIAVKSAQTAFVGWSSKTVKDRVKVLFRFHSLLIEHADELADLIVLEHGKTKAEALASVAKGNETVEYAISLPQLIQGKMLEVSRGVHCHDIRLPLGVVASIVPFNFPIMVPMWTLPIAIAAGNCMVLKPSEKVPLTMCRVVELLKEAGLPDGVVNLVQGTAEAVNALCDHPLVKAVTFVGTSKVAELVSTRCRSLNKRALALGGAKNFLVAAPDCDVDMASQDIVNSFSGCAGQRCMAASALLVIGEQPSLLQMIVERAKSLTPGSGQGQMGPVINQASLDKIHHYIEDSIKSGATLLLDGRHWGTEKKKGFWVGPTVLLHKNKEDKALCDEIFGPVLSIYQCTTAEEAISIQNANPYGNAACIYTTTGATAELFTKRFSSAMIGVNIGVPVPREPFSFGGTGLSKFGDCDITGDGGVEFFTQRRKVTTKWTIPKEKSWLS